MENQQLSQIVMRVLENYAKLSSPSLGVTAKTVFDITNNRYQILKHGWEDEKRYFYNVVYIDVKDNLVWIQDDNTEVGIANLLLEQGITKDSIVLGFQPPAYRKYTEFNPSV